MRVLKTTWTSRKGEKIRTRNWYIEFRDHLEIVRRISGFTDKALTEALGRKIVRLVEFKIAGEQLDSQMITWLEQIPSSLKEKFVKIGLIDNRRASASKPLDQHLEDFRKSLLARGNTIGYIDTVITRAKRVIENCGFIFWSDISASQVEKYLADLRSNEQGISAQTFNFYLQAIKQFCKWMVDDRRASTSPIKHLKGLNVRTDRRHDRRALEVDEIKKLLKTTIKAPKRLNMTGYERMVLYRLAIETGLRAKELKSLTVSSFDFESKIVSVTAAYCKNRKQALIPIRKDTNELIKKLAKGKMPNVKIFKIPYKTASMLKADLSDAGIPYVDDSGRYADFHSLRHTTGSLLAASGVHPKVVQSIMRHSDINLTMSRYTHIFRGQEAEAVAKLPNFSIANTKSSITSPTGTDG